MGYSPPSFGVTRRQFAATTATKVGGIYPICTPLIPPIYPQYAPIGALPAAVPLCRSRRCWPVWARSARPRLPVGVWSAPPGGADFGRYAPRFWVLRALNTPASGGCGYEKGRPDLDGLFRLGGSITRRSQNLSPGPATMPAGYAPGSVLPAAIGLDKHQSTGAGQWLYRRHVPHRRTPARLNNQ